MSAYAPFAGQPPRDWNVHGPWPPRPRYSQADVDALGDAQSPGAPPYAPEPPVPGEMAAPTPSHYQLAPHPLPLDPPLMPLRAPKTASTGTVLAAGAFFLALIALLQ